LSDQLSLVSDALAIPARFHFGFTHLPVSHEYTPPSGFEDDQNSVQYQKYEDLFAGKPGHIVFSGHTHVKHNYALGSSGPVRNLVLGTALKGSWTLVHVSPSQSQIFQYKCDDSGNNCFTSDANPVILLP